MRDPQDDTSGVSLVEVMIAVSIMGTAAVMYASGWNLHRGQNEAARELELATEIYLRQVESIKRHRVKGLTPPNVPFNEVAFFDRACPPGRPDVLDGTFYRTVAPFAGQGVGSTQLHPAQPRNLLLSDGINGRPPQNAHRILPTNDVVGDPFLVQLPPEMTNPVTAGGLGYSVSVCCARLHEVDLPGAPPTLATLNGPGSHLHQLIKYCVRVDRDPGGGPRNILTHEFIMEVR